MALEFLLPHVRKLNPVMDKTGEDFSLDCIDKTIIPETARTYNAVDYRKPFIPYNQTLNTHAIHAGSA